MAVNVTQFISEKFFNGLIGANIYKNLAAGPGLHCSQAKNPANFELAIAVLLQISAGRVPSGTTWMK
jgi:hypothetical protein